MRGFRSVLSAIAGLVLLTWLVPTASAAPGTPITCGMVVSRDAVLYLAEDLICPDFGVQVFQDLGEGIPGPKVLVDLRGHSLSGLGTGRGITAFTTDQGVAFLEVINGRLQNWDVAVGGDHETHTRNVALIGNRVGFFCARMCVADRTYFRRNSDAGFFVGSEGSGTVTGSSFVENAIGASVGVFSGLSINGSRFFNNAVGVFANGTQVSISNSLFVKNDTAIRVVATFDDDVACADLHKVVFVRNRVRLDGPQCTP